MPIKVAVKTGITCIALAWLVSVVPVRAVGQALASADPWPLGAGLILMFAMRVAATVRMKVVADAQELGMSAAALLRLLFAANFYALLLPGTLAGGTATWARYVQQGASRSGALMAIVASRTVGLATTIALGLVAWTIERRSGPAATALAVSLAAAVLICVCIGFFARPQYAGSLLLAASRLRWVRDSSLPEVIRDLAARFMRFGSVRPSIAGQVIASSILHDLLATGVLWAFAAAIDLGLGFWAVVWIRAALQVVLLLPISFAGLGVREVTLVGLTAAYGIDSSTAVAWSLIMLAGTVTAAMVGAGLEAHALWGQPRARTVTGADSPAGRENR